MSKVYVVSETSGRGGVSKHKFIINLDDVNRVKQLLQQNEEELEEWIDNVENYEKGNFLFQVAESLRANNDVIKKLIENQRVWVCGEETLYGVGFSKEDAHKAFFEGDSESSDESWE